MKITTREIKVKMWSVEAIEGGKKTKIGVFTSKKEARNAKLAYIAEKINEEE